MKWKHFKESKFTYVEQLKARLRDKEEENHILKKRIEGIEGRLDKIENGFTTQSPADAPSTNDELDQVSCFWDSNGLIC